jgi:hypothetical protein
MQLLEARCKEAATELFSNESCHLMLVPHGTWLSLQKSAPSEMRASLSCELTAGKTQDETTRSLSVVNRLIRLNNASGHAGHTGKSRLVMANLVPNIEAGCQSVPD